ncbi:MAG: site-specific DNA-methyltransferase [Sulfuricella sp.]
MNKLKMHSPDLIKNNIDSVRKLFPECIVEAKMEDGSVYEAVDFDILRQELSGLVIEGPQERYQVNWPGKREALLTANAPIAKTMRPCRKESVDFDTTQNLFIEGDNLDALKLLQEAYLNKVKMIYIDPPYNTGNDFIYEDDFSVDSENYKQRSNQKDEAGNHMVANTESNGRFHSDWLSMIYPRLKLARTLLRDDGMIFVSIDDGEVANLRRLCDEVFGEDGFVGQLIWKSRVSEDTRAKTGLSTDHEYILCYRKGIEAALRGSEKDLEKFSNPDNDHRGAWRSADMTGLATEDKRPNLHYDLIDPETLLNYGCPPKGWRFDQRTMSKKVNEKRIIWPSNHDGRPRQKLFLEEMESIYKNISSVIQGISTSTGTKEINQLLGDGVFDFPKPSGLIKIFVQQATNQDELILDFFAGSGTTAHAIMSLNAEDSGKRKFIMVQLPEVCDEKSEAFKSGFKTIADIGKERIRRASKKIIEDNAGKDGIDQLDIGFRVLKVDSSNMKDVYYAPDAVKQGDLLAQVDNIREDRTPEDLLFQVLLDWGVDLALPITQEVIFGKTIFFVDGNALAACFETGINEEFVKALAARHPLRAVFRDAGFGSDSVKINIEQIFKLISPTTEVKSI